MRKKCKRQVVVVRGVFAPRMPKKQCDELALSYHSALFRLSQGLGDEKDLWTLSAMMEMVAIGLEMSRLSQALKDQGLATLRDTFSGLMRAVWRGHDGKSWGLDGDTLQLMRDIVTEHDKQVATAAHAEVEVWVSEAYRRASGKGIFAIDSSGVVRNVADLPVDSVLIEVAA